MNYDKSAFFQGLWTIPPQGLTLDKWKDRCGSRREILTGHTDHKTLQLRICHYLGLQTAEVMEEY